MAVGLVHDWVVTDFAIGNLPQWLVPTYAQATYFRAGYEGTIVHVSERCSCCPETRRRQLSEGEMLVRIPGQPLRVEPTEVMHHAW